MSQPLAHEIDRFEETYMVRLQNWCALLPEEDLDQVIQNLEDIKARSEAITQRFDGAQRQLFESRWRPILQRLQSQLPSLMRQLNTIQARTRMKTNNLDRGQVGLKGYRQTLPPNQRIKFDTDA